MDRKEILQKINKVKYWRHRIDLGNGIFTPGRENPRASDYLGLPRDLSGKTVLDIGAWDGLYSFEAERRGAERVLATDVWYDPKIGKEWWEGIREGMEGFLTVREILGSKVEYKNIDVYDISPETVGEFDIVLFLGVLYHLPDPFLALKRVASVTREMVVVESQVAKTKSENIPLMRFRYTNVPTTKNPSWDPNLLCLKQLIMAAGFKDIEVSISSGLRTSTLPIRTIVGTNTYLRSEPNMLGKTITVLDKGKRVIVVGAADEEIEITQIKKDCWYRIETKVDMENIQGWVEGASLGPTAADRMSMVKSFIPTVTGLKAKLIGHPEKVYRAIVKGYK